MDLRQTAEDLRQRLQRNSGTEPPKETGERLGTLRRNDGAEIHINWDTYEGRSFLRIQPWKKDPRGRLWPVKGAGVTIRLRELPEFASAVASAMDKAQQAAEASQQAAVPEKP